MKSIALVVGVAAFALILVSTGYPQQSAEQLFQSAIYKEEVEGELDAAIKIYKTIIDEYPENRSVAAKALLHTGLCYEKLGNAQASKAYERVVRNFADQAEIVAQARVRLAALGAGTAARSTEITIRRVWAGPGANAEGSPSPDGRYLSYTDWETPDLAVRDLVTGENRRVTKKKPGLPYAWPDNSIFSPDGKQIAYRWFISPDACELRTIALDGSGERVLNRDKEYPSRLDWSPDGRHILTKLGERPVLIAVADGSIQELVIENPGMMCFSPDGGYIAYDSPQTKDVRQSDVYVYERKTQRTSLLVGHPADDRLLGWSPDGRHVLFASDRRGTKDAWLIAVSGGQPRGEPMLVRSDIGGLGDGKGFTRMGGYFFSNWGDANDVFSTRLDIKTGKLLSPPAEVAGSYLGSNRQPDFSRDGKSLAYVTGQGGIVIQSLETPDKELIKPGVKIGWTGQMGGLHWATDGRSFVATGVDRQRREGLFRINSPTGEATLWFEPAHPWVQAFDLSPDGRKVFYQGMTPAGLSLYVWDSESGEESQLQVGAKGVWSLAVSPDGKQLAYFRKRDLAESNGLFVMPSTGGTPRLLVKVADSRGRVAWSPDGHQLLYAIPSKSTANGTPATLRYELWRVPSEGGEPQQSDLTVDGMLTSLRIHPDGQRMVYATYRVDSEVWVMENFLPKEDGEKK
jgi:Tol biopolymer transport system component